MAKKGDDEKRVYIPLRVDQSTDEQLVAAMANLRLTKSEVIRTYIQRGLEDDGLRPNDERLYEMILQAVKESMHQPVERLAAISAKTAHISAAAYFFEIFLAQVIADASQQELINMKASRALQLGIEYLKEKGIRIDDMIERGAQRMREDE